MQKEVKKMLKFYGNINTMYFILKIILIRSGGQKSQYYLYHWKNINRFTSTLFRIKI